MTDCAKVNSNIADLLFDPTTVAPEVQAHVDACVHCREELTAIKVTMSAMDDWAAPEPNPYFLTRMEARLDEVRNEPQGWFARLRTRLISGNMHGSRSFAAVALTAIIVIGGGTYLSIANWNNSTGTGQQQAPVVRDLQSLDNNAQLLDQLEDLSSSNGNTQY